MDFNVGIILCPDDWSHIINMTEVEDYVQLEAAVDHWSWDNGRVLNKTMIPLVPCSIDKFHEPYGPLRDILLSAIPFAYCMSDHEDLVLQGSAFTEIIQSINIGLKRCTNKPSCKNETEINEFIDRNGQL